MPKRDEATFVLHGLDVDNRVVRADVFVRKLRSLLTALRAADKFANNRVSFMYMITGLAPGSASVTVREKVKRLGGSVRSGIDVLELAANAVYNGDRSLSVLPVSLIAQVQKLGEGVSTAFSHAELAFADDNVIRIDDYLVRQSNAAMRIRSASDEAPPDRFYRGLAVGTFDGILKEIDARGLVLRGKLILSAGQLEVDCVMNKERIPEAVECFDKRVIVEGTAHYDGDNQIPSRLDVRAIRVVGQRPTILRWRGAFAAPSADHDEEDWDGNG